MAEVKLDIKQWGNNLGVRLPATIARQAHLHVDQRVSIAVEGAKIIITPEQSSGLSLEQRLSQFDPARHGSELMQTDHQLGAEKW